MTHIRDIYRPEHTTKPGRAHPFHDDGRRLMRREWADFCTQSCPHPAQRCDRRPCPEFRARFGRRADL